MKKFATLLTVFTLSIPAFAAINSQINFEGEMPSFIKVNGNGQAEISGEKFKDGRQSIKFTWEQGGELVFGNFSDIEASM